MAMVEVSMFAVTAKRMEKARMRIVSEIDSVGHTLSGPEGDFYSAFIYLDDPTDEDYRTLNDILNDYLARNVLMAVGVYSRSDGNITTKILNYTEENE